MFDGIPPTHWFGPTHPAFCVDYSVGHRFEPRRVGGDLRKNHGLAAMRWPEKLLFFDDTNEPVQT